MITYTTEAVFLLFNFFFTTWLMLREYIIMMIPGCHFCNSSCADEDSQLYFPLLIKRWIEEFLSSEPLIFLGKQMHQDSSPHSPLNKNRQLFSSKSIRLQCYNFKRQNVFSTNKDLEPQPHDLYFITLISQSDTGPPVLIFFQKTYMSHQVISKLPQQEFKLH